MHTNVTWVYWQGDLDYTYLEYQFECTGQGVA